MFLEFTLLVIMALVHLLASKLRFLQSIPRSIWLSIAGGASVSYIFLHLIPQLAETSEELQILDHHLSIFIIALMGLCFIYGLEKLAKEQKHHSEQKVFWVHMFSYGIYNFIIGYLLVDYPEVGLTPLLLFFLAISLHLLVNDSGLLFHHKDMYIKLGKWIVAATVIIGGIVGATVPLSGKIIDGAEAFLAGGIIMNTLKEELPENRKSKYWAFILGTVIYAALLIFLSESE